MGYRARWMQYTGSNSQTTFHTLRIICRLGCRYIFSSPRSHGLLDQIPSHAFWCFPAHLRLGRLLLRARPGRALQQTPSGGLARPETTPSSFLPLTEPPGRWARCPQLERRLLRHSLHASPVGGRSALRRSSILAHARRCCWWLDDACASSPGLNRLGLAPDWILTLNAFATGAGHNPPWPRVLLNRPLSTPSEPRIPRRPDQP